MPKESMTHSVDGTELIPSTDEEWEEWVSASATRNYVLDDPLLDWLDRYGETEGFVRDEIDERTDFTAFVFAKRVAFEQALVDHLRDLGAGEVRAMATLNAGSGARRDVAVAVATFDAMAEAVPIIWRGSLRDAQTRTYGFPSLLVRSDVFAGQFPNAPASAGSGVGAPDLGIGRRHYVVVDIVYSTLELRSDGSLSDSDARPAYKVQAFIHNRSLGRLQGYRPPEAFLLGRGWRQTTRGATTRVNNCMNRLAPVGNSDRCRGMSLDSLTDRAADWIRLMRRDGAAWDVLPTPSLHELRPSATPSARGNAAVWASAIRRIVDEGQDLTRLWQVGVSKRKEANARGLTRWSDPRVTPEALGITGPVQRPTLRALLEVNRDGGPAVRPAHIGAQRWTWIEAQPVEFYVDFETVNDLDDDFSELPEKGGQPLIFMIGCGHVEQDTWRFECFVADRITDPAEAAIIDEWIAHMTEVRDRLAPGTTSRIIHWSAHETSSLETAYNAALIRHPGKEATWGRLHWFDFLEQVIKREPVAVRGAHGFGLKAVTNALHALGHITTQWDSGPADGLGAMVGAWWCERQLEHGRAQRLIDVGLMQAIRDYNQVDCRAMMEIICYLRNNH